MKTQIVNIKNVNKSTIFQTLQDGNIIAYPTDTIYGIGADIYNKKAVEKLFDTKDRDYSKPVSLLYFNKNKVLEDFTHLSDYEKKFIDKFFPGPMTLILRVENDQQFPYPFINNGYVGIRVIDHPKLNLIMQNYPNPITTTSINPTGEKPAENIEEILDYFPDQMSIIIEDGSTVNKVSSTVLKIYQHNYTILRESSLTQEEIEYRINHK